MFESLKKIFNIGNNSNFTKELLGNSVFFDINLPIALVDANGYILLVNSAFENTFGFSKEELLTQKMSLLKSDQHERHFYENIYKELYSHGSYEGKIWNTSKNSEQHYYKLQISSLQTNSDDTHYICVYTDITDDYNHLNRIQFLATHDSLTGLSNRTVLYHQIDSAIERSKRTKNTFYLLFCDLDNFKELNDSYGHAFGDRILQDVAKSIQNSFRKSDTISRYGGDEFIILLEGVEDDIALQKTIQTLNQVISSLSHNYENASNISISIGYSKYPENGSHREALIQHSDESMYKIKFDKKY